MFLCLRDFYQMPNLGTIGFVDKQSVRFMIVIEEDRNHEEPFDPLERSFDN